MLRLGDNYFDSSYTRCAIHDGQVAGVIVGFPVSEKTAIDQKSGKDFARAMGFFRFLARMPLFMRMDRMMPTVEDEDGYYVHTITVEAEYGGRGFGSEMIERVASRRGGLDGAQGSRALTGVDGQGLSSRPHLLAFSLFPGRCRIETRSQRTLPPRNPALPPVAR